MTLAASPPSRRVFIRHMEVHAAEGGERGAKVTPFVQSRDAGDRHTGRRVSWFRYMDVPAAEGGERRAKVTPFAQSSDARDRSPSRRFTSIQ
jgi:hypothetical protein